MKAKKINNLDTLEKEIYRLKLESRKMEEKMGSNFEHLQENYSSMFMNSFSFKKKNAEEGHHNFFDSFFKNESFNAAVNKVTDHIANRAAEGIEDLIDKLFHKKKHDH